MLDNLMVESWESFFIEGRRVGFLHRVVSFTESVNILVSKLNIFYGGTRFSHDYYFYNEAGYPSHSYLYDFDDGAPLHVRFVGNKLIGQIDDHIFSEWVPLNSRPSYGNYPLLVTIPFKENFKSTFTQIEDNSCTVKGITELVSQGWEYVEVNGQSLRLWRVDEYTKGKLGNRYWLDETRRIRLTKWKGATSFWVASKEEAVRNLHPKFWEVADNLVNHDNGSDWVMEVENWLHQKMNQ